MALKEAAGIADLAIRKSLDFGNRAEYTIHSGTVILSCLLCVPICDRSIIVQCPESPGAVPKKATKSMANVYAPKGTGQNRLHEKEHAMTTEGPLLRIFEVRTKEGCAEALLESFATTSADVVRGKPGTKGYFFGRCVQGDENVVMFVSVWKDLDAVKSRFGDDWQASYLPDGYEDLIDECSVRHFDLSSGWHVEGL